MQVDCWAILRRTMAKTKTKDRSISVCPETQSTGSKLSPQCFFPFEDVQPGRCLLDLNRHFHSTGEDAGHLIAGSHETHLSIQRECVESH